mgnify:CR=1 FL=1
MGPRGSAALSSRAPTREDLDAQVTATQQQLAKLREAQEQLERARSELEEIGHRVRRIETRLARALIGGKIADDSVVTFKLKGEELVAEGVAS